MTAWFVDWIGEGTGGGGVIQRINNEDITKPVQTAMIDLLREELPEVEVWPDVNQSSGAVEAVVVQSRAGEWINSSSIFQRRTRDVDIYAFAPTSDAAERLRDQIVLIVRGTQQFILTHLSEIPGGWDDESQTYVRGFTVTARVAISKDA